MKIILGREHVIVRGIRPEEQLWGPYQFPLPYRLDDRLVVSVHVHDDGISHWGKVNRWFESFDEGVTWQETDPSVAAQCGLKLPNGDRIYFPPESAIDLSSYQIPHFPPDPGLRFFRQSRRRHAAHTGRSFLVGAYAGARLSVGAAAAQSG